MSHMVIYRTADGQPGYHQTGELEDAVQFVERLRNTEGVDHPRIFQMEEVTFDFRPYFRVEIGSGGEQMAAAAPSPPSAPEPAWSPEPPADAAPEPARDPFAEVASEPARDPFAEVASEPARDPFAEVAPEPFGEAPPHPQPLTQPLPQLDPEPMGTADLAPPPPPPAPAPAAAGTEVEENGSETSENGLGARRGLFGR